MINNNSNDNEDDNNRGDGNERFTRWVLSLEVGGCTDFTGKGLNG